MLNGCMRQAGTVGPPAHHRNQTQSYEQAVDVLQALLDDPSHAILAARYRGFDGTGGSR